MKKSLLVSSLSLFFLLAIAYGVYAILVDESSNSQEPSDLVGVQEQGLSQNLLANQSQRKSEKRGYVIYSDSSIEFEVSDQWTLHQKPHPLGLLQVEELDVDRRQKIFIRAFSSKIDPNETHEQVHAKTFSIISSGIEIKNLKTKTDSPPKKNINATDWLYTTGSANFGGRYAIFHQLSALKNQNYSTLVIYVFDQKYATQDEPLNSILNSIKILQ